MGIIGGSQRKLESAFNNLRVYYKIVGIIMIIILAFFVLALLVARFGKVA